MTGGRTNRLWRASGHGGEIVIKAYAPPSDDNPLFSNDPTAEALILHHLKDTGLAPKLHGALDTSLGPSCSMRWFMADHGNKMWRRSRVN